MIRKLALALATAAALGGMTSSAHAQSADVATAQALFDEGKRLMNAGNYAEGCPKLVESQRLDPGGGTLFAIAICHEGEGKTATAWADYNVALAEARRDNRKDRETAAAEKERALEPKLTKVRVQVNEKTPGVSVTRDGARVGEAQWGTALPVDPGKHVFVVKAPGKIDLTQTIELVGEGQTIDVVLPVLEDAPRPVEPPAPPVRTQPVPPTPEERGISAQKAWAVVAGTAGVVGLGVGFGYGASAITKWHDAEAKCPQKQCTDHSNISLGSDAGRAADLSTVLVAVGAGALIAGVVLWITAPKSAERRAGSVNVVPTASRDGFGLSLGGAL